MARYEVRVREIAEELQQMKSEQTQWRRTLRARFDESNGNAWVRYLRNHFDTDKVFKGIKTGSTACDIYATLTKYSL